VLCPIVAMEEAHPLLARIDADVPMKLPEDPIVPIIDTAIAVPIIRSIMLLFIPRRPSLGSRRM